GRDVDDVVPLRAHLALGLDLLRPVNHHPVAGAAVARGDLLGPGERRVPGDRPAGGVVVVRRRAAELVVVLQDVGDRLVHAVEVRHLVVQAYHAALGAGAVVADDVEDERVVELAEILDGPDQPTDLGVGVLAVAGEHFHLAGEELLLVRAQRRPVFDGRRLRRELRVRRYHAQTLLAGQGLLAYGVPALIELAPVFRDPRLGHVMGRMGGTRREVHEERLVPRERPLGPNPWKRPGVPVRPG